MSNLINSLRRNLFLRFSYKYFLAIKDYFLFKPLDFIKNNVWFFSDYYKYRKVNNNPNYKLEFKDLWPCLSDKKSITPLDPVYFYQDCWAAKKIFEIKPKHHYDVGSMAKTIGLISQYVPTTMIDIRPIELTLDNLFFIEGSILALPFKDNSVESISSICVIEHIGLGRYGDPIDPWGSEKAIKELIRVTSAQGHILISVPVDDSNKVMFNGCRTFTPQYLKKLFENCELIEEKYIYGKELIDKYKIEKGYGVGLYMFKKIGQKN